MIQFLIEKEIKQLWRDPFIPKMLVGFTLMMILVMPFATNQEVKDLKVCVVIHERDSYTDRLIQKIAASNYFDLSEVVYGYEEALRQVEREKADLILELPSGFEKHLITEGVTNVMISANAVNGIKGGLGGAYLTNILTDYATEIREEWPQLTGNEILPIIQVLPQNRFNPHLDYKVFMVPALLVVLLTMLCGFLPALNIVSEKEKGTIEQMNVTPVNRYTFILSKLILYWVIGFVILTICFGLIAWVFRLYPVGNLGVIYLFTAIYLLVVSALGLLVSNNSATMQQAMFVMFFFMMIFFMMSGLFTPISSMPEWAQVVTRFNPLRYFMEVMRGVYLKGSGLSDLLPQLLTLSIFAVILNFLAVISYKKSE